MLTPSDIRFIELVLEMFSIATRVPVTFYELGESSLVIESVRSNEKWSPAYCRRMRNIGHENQVECAEDMCGRAKGAIAGTGLTNAMCYAGLSNLTGPIMAEDRVLGAIQYGAFLYGGDHLSNERLLRLSTVAKSLELTESELDELRCILFNTTPRKNDAEVEALKEMAIALASTLSVYIVQRQNERGLQVAANHDLQLRLQAVLGHAENLLNAMPADSAMVPDFEDLLGAAEAAGSVMHSLTRGTYLQKDYRFARHEIRGFIERSIILCRAQAFKKKIDLRLDLQPRDGRFFIQVSERHLQQAFNNLVQNAVKYSYRTTVQSSRRYVRIRGRIVDRGYEVVISNYGVGIEPDEYEMIFQDGYKGRLTKGEYRSGSGQGLGLTKSIVSNHGGSVTVSSEPLGEEYEDCGRPYLTRFRVWLPFRQLES